MSGPGSELLRMLGSGVTPGVDRAGAPPAGRAAGALDFGSLLDRARAGTLSSGRTVTVGRGVGVSLSESQIARVSAAADRAESQGATSALVVIDGIGLKVDLTMREITGVVDLGAGALLTGVDAVVHVPGEEAGPGAMKPARPGAGWSAATLLGRLAGGRRDS